MPVNNLGRTSDNSCLRIVPASSFLGPFIRGKVKLGMRAGEVFKGQRRSNSTKIMIKSGHAMIKSGQELTRCRAIITSACSMLVDSRRSITELGRELPYSSADCYVLLQDASKLYCQYVSEQYGEPAATRWSPSLPEVLLAHPDRCHETLALIERKEFKPISYLHFVAA